MRNSPATATATWDTAVELEHVTKFFDQKRPISLLKRETVRIHALDDVSMRIARGEFVAYAGPNGAGKSTTFKLLSGMLVPQSGLVRVFGQDPYASRIEIMKKTGILFGNRSELWWDHPVRASFEWKRTVWQIDGGTYNRMLDTVSELLGLNELMNVFARELSLGQRMRANLGLTLLHDPELILLDEPTLGLDVLAKRMMIEFLKRVHKEQKKTILVTSHDMDDLTEMADRLILLSKGKIAFDGEHGKLVLQSGDRRLLRLSTSGVAPSLPGATLLGRENGGFLYEYDAGRTKVSQLMRALSEAPGVTDVETSRAPIESIIAELYRDWA